MEKKGADEYLIYTYLYKHVAGETKYEEFLKLLTP